MLSSKISSQSLRGKLRTDVFTEQFIARVHTGTITHPELYPAGSTVGFAYGTFENEAINIIVDGRQIFLIKYVDRRLEGFFWRGCGQNGKYAPDMPPGGKAYHWMTLCAREEFAALLFLNPSHGEDIRF